MLIIFKILIIAFCIIMALPVLVLLIQSLYSRKNVNNASVLDDLKLSSVILVPAHNEEKGIKMTLSKLQLELTENDKILVIADNCNDGTANIVRDMGIEVIERISESLRGKSYALDFGVKHIAINPPDVVIIFDADCEPKSGKLRDLIVRCAQNNRPVQCLYLMLAPKGAKIKTKIAAFAWLFKNKVRALGNLNLGLPCQLMGSGMAFPWDIISKVDLATGSIVEDLKLGLDCAELRLYPELYTDFTVTSEFPLDTSSEKTQRTRWEHGHLSVILSELPRFIKRAISKKDLKFFSMVVDAAVPPLALLVMFQLILVLLSIVFLYGDFYLPLYISFYSFTCLAITVMYAWFHFGKETIRLTELIMIPIYIIKKIPVYIKFIFKRQLNWVRTKRD